MADPKERFTDPMDSLQTFFEGMMQGVWTAMPGIIQSFDPVKGTVSVQPSIQGVKVDKGGVRSFVDMPLCLDCPVQFPSGGGFCATWPVAAGDECLLVFASRCIDSWWQNGGTQPPADHRFHDLSDGFALLGFRSVPRAIPNVSTTSAQFRSDDGTVFFDVAGDKAKVSAPHVKVHAGISYSWDVHGYGQVITWTGGNNYRYDNYMTGANITTVAHDIQPPEAP